MAVSCMQQFYAHCVCVVGRNYRLQNIHLIKITGAPAFGLRAERKISVTFQRP